MQLPEEFRRLATFNSLEKVNIQINTKSFSINKSLAIAISPLFYERIQENPTIKTLSIPSLNDEYFEEFEDFFRGEKIDKILFLKISLLINNEDFIQKWKKENKPNKENVVEQLLTLINYNGRMEYMKEEIEFIGNNFEEIEKMENFDKIPNKYLSEIFKNIRNIKSEERIYINIIKRLKKENEENTRRELLKRIEFRGLSISEVLDILDNIKYEDISETTFLKLKDLFQKIGIENQQIDKETRVKIMLSSFQKRCEQDEEYQKTIGFSMLHFASKINSAEIGTLLISKGADVNEKTINSQNRERFFLLR